jgi:hypothetical protein
LTSQLNLCIWFVHIIKAQEVAMAGPGFADTAQSGFSDAEALFGRATIGEVRRFGPVGPAYEVIGIKTAGDVEIYVIETGEQLDYSLADFLADPIALTVP